jgi:uncharacterized protein (DUF1330 family)
MPKAYWISSYLKIIDKNKVAAYRKLAIPAITSCGGRFLARGLPEKAYDLGMIERVVIIEFESVEAAISAHDSPDYQAALKALDGGLEREIRIVEGIE